MNLKRFFVVLFALSTLSPLVKAVDNKILVVYDPAVIDAVTGKNPDFPLVYMLREAGHMAQGIAIPTLNTATQIQIDSLNNAALVIIARGHSSGNFSSPHKEKWNAITAPVICTNLWGLRNSRGNWFNDATVTNVPWVGNGTSITATIPNLTDPVFEGMTSPINWWSGSYSIFSGTSAGNGTIMATTATGVILFARFEPNVVFYAGTTDKPSGPRTYIGNGTDYVTSGPIVYNFWNLTTEFKQVFLKEVARMKNKGLTTKIKSNFNNNNLKVYQNTAANLFVIEMKDLNKVEVYNNMGQIIISVNAQSDKISIAADKLCNGIYFVKSYSKDRQIATAKIIKR